MYTVENIRYYRFKADSSKYRPYNQRNIDDKEIKKFYCFNRIFLLLVS